MEHLSAAGVSLVIDTGGPRLPAIVHWGAALGDLTERQLYKQVRGLLHTGTLVHGTAGVRLPVLYPDRVVLLRLEPGDPR
jgi:hypothetical protein